MLSHGIKYINSVSFSIIYNSLDPMDRSLPGSFVHVISQARILKWVAISFSRGSSRPRDQTWASCIVGRALPSEPPEIFGISLNPQGSN